MNDFDRSQQGFYAQGLPMTAEDFGALLSRPGPRHADRSSIDWLGRQTLEVWGTLRSVLSLMLLTICSLKCPPPNATPSLWHLTRQQIARSGVRLLPWAGLLAAGLGLIVVGQMLSVLSEFGAQHYVGVVLVSAVINELGPIVMSMLVLSVMGTATVIELTTARARGQMPRLESHPTLAVRVLVLPRVIGFGVSIICLSAFFIFLTMVFAYGVVFLKNVPLTPSTFGRQILSSLSWGSFAVLIAKSFLFGVIIGIVTCHEGLVRPLDPARISAATVRAVVSCIGLCAVSDSIFIGYRLLF